MAPHSSIPRERGRRLLSRLNRWMVAGAVTLAGVFSVVAAESTHKTNSSAATSLQQPSQTPTATTSSSGSTGSSSGSSGSASSSGASSSASTGVVSGGS